MLHESAEGNSPSISEEKALTEFLFLEFLSLRRLIELGKDSRVEGVRSSCYSEL